MKTSQLMSKYCGHAEEILICIFKFYNWVKHEYTFIKLFNDNNQYRYSVNKKNASSYIG